mmetsp:Transcript_34242/g.94585  ORF Transcript_34242/g.94585 Transcript_34242/m.94585 type:complete len:196 (-) Transcript_34242:64-651(-)
MRLSPWALAAALLGAGAEAVAPNPRVKNCRELAPAVAPRLSLLQLPARRVVKHGAAGDRKDAAGSMPGLAASTGAQQNVALLDRLAVALGADPDDSSGESAVGRALKELGLAVLLGFGCVVAVGAHKAWHGGVNVYEVLLTAGVFQLVVTGGAVAIYLLSSLVTIPGYLVIFAFGTVWNGFIHCRADVKPVLSGG